MKQPKDFVLVGSDQWILLQLLKKHDNLSVESMCFYLKDVFKDPITIRTRRISQLLWKLKNKGVVDSVRMPDTNKHTWFAK